MRCESAEQRTERYSLDSMRRSSDIPPMAREVELTDEFGAWFRHELDSEERKRIVAAVTLLEEHGPQLGFPTVQMFVSLVTGRCANSVSNIKGGLTGCFMLSIRAA